MLAMRSACMPGPAPCRVVINGASPCPPLLVIDYDRAGASPEVATEGRAARHQYARLTAQAVLAETQGDLHKAARLYEQVAEQWTQYGHVLEREQGLLGAGRCLVRLTRPQAAPKLQDARTSFATLVARPLLAETDAWLLDAAAQNL